MRRWETEEGPGLKRCLEEGSDLSPADRGRPAGTHRREGSRCEREERTPSSVARPGRGGCPVVITGSQVGAVKVCFLPSTCSCRSAGCPAAVVLPRDPSLMQQVQEACRLNTGVESFRWE